MRKHYRATFLLGRTSDTDDTAGHVTELPLAPAPTRTEIDEALPRFVGRIEQRPPAHSAMKLKGRRAYDLARRGVAVELPHRAVSIYGLKVARYNFPALDLEIDCGSGTYVRALGRDLAAALGTAAVMSALERTAVGRFRVEDAVAMESLTAETMTNHLQPPQAAVADLPIITLDDAQLAEIRHGRPIALPADVPREPPAGASCEWAALDSAGKLVAILREKRPGQLWPHRNFI
jgi:tRNA pseudouridine55 synthase